MPAQPGERVGGRWALEAPLGSGGTGAVWRGREVATGQAVAVKLVLDELSAGAALRRRFEGEVRALLRLDHPGVVRVLDAGLHRGAPFLVLELVEGRSLQDLLQAEGPLHPRRAVELARDLARALAAAHAAGVLHRDLKPDNVLLDGQGRARLVDFGLALDLDGSHSRITQSGAFLGTPGYWAPEQARGELLRIDARADVYGLGATLYALLTGRPPFQATTVLEILQLTAHEAPTPPERLRPGLDPDLGRLVMGCLEKDPQRRPPSALALAEALDAWLARPPSPRPGPSRRPLLLLIGVACALTWLGLELRRRGREDEARAVLERALALARGGRSAECRAELDAALALDPSNAAAWTQLAETALAMDDPAGGLEAATRALELDPGSSLAALLRADARAVLQDPRGALADVERALELDPGSVRGLVTRSHLRLRQGDPTAALADLDAAVRLAPGQGWVWALRAERRASRDLPGALADYDRAVALDPEAHQLHTARGQLRERAGDEAGAEADYLAAVEATRSSDALEALAGLRLRRGGDLRGLLPHLDAAVAEGAPPEVFELRARIRRRLGDPQGALEDLEQALALNPGSIGAFAERATLYDQQGRWAEAEADFGQVIALSVRPTTAPFTNRAAVRIKLERLDDAAADLEAALRVDPRTPTALDLRGVIEHRRERFAEALEWYDRALAVNPHHHGALENRVSALLRLRRFEEAREAALRALSLLPRDGSAAAREGRLRSHLAEATRPAPR